MLLVNGGIVSISTTPYYRTNSASLMYLWSMVKQWVSVPLHATEQVLLPLCAACQWWNSEYQYHSMLQNENCFLYVLLVNGETVSISATPYYRQVLLPLCTAGQWWNSDYCHHSILQNQYCFPYVLLVNGEIVSIATTEYYRTNTASIMYCWSMVK